MNQTDETLRAEIDRRARQFEACFRARDVSGILDCYYADHPIISAPDAPLLEGRAALREVMTQLIASYREISLDLVRLERGGELAYELGNGRLSGGESEDLELRYLVVWRRQDDQWRAETDFFAPGELN